MPKKTDINLEGKKNYEVSFLLKDPASENMVLDLLSQHKAVITNQSSVNSIKLAYPIKKHSFAYFGYINFEADPNDIKSVSDTLKFNSEVIRFLVISLSAVKKSERKTELKKPVQTETITSKSMLSNKALEEKLEEILK